MVAADAHTENPNLSLPAVRSVPHGVLEALADSQAMRETPRHAPNSLALEEPLPYTCTTAPWLFLLTESRSASGYKRMAAVQKRRWSAALLAPAFVAAQVLCFCAATQAATGVAGISRAPAQSRESKAGHDCCPDGKKRDDSRSQHGSCGHCNPAEICAAERSSTPGPVASSFSFVAPALSFAEIELPVSHHTPSAAERGGSPPGASLLRLKCVLLI